MMAEKSSECTQQSSGAGENDVRKIESSAKTNDSVLPEKFGCRANSKVVPPWVAGCVARVLHRSEKHHKVRVRSKMRKFRDVLTQDGGTVDPGDERCETATVDPGRVTGTSLGRTDANDECPSQKCTTSEHWQPGLFSSPTSVPRNGGKLALKPTMGHRRKYVSKSFIRRKSVTFGCSEHKGVSSRRVSERREKLGHVVQPETVQRVDQTAGTRSADHLRFLAEAEMKAVDSDQCFDTDDSEADDFEAILGRNAAVLTGPRLHLEDNPMSSSAKRACAIPPPVSRILTQPDVGMVTVPLPVPEDAMEVDFDAGVEPVLVRRGTKRASSMREVRADQTDMEVCPDTAGECCNRDAFETLSWHATAIKTEQIPVQECEMPRRCHKYEKSSMQTVISTTTSHKAKRDETQPRVVTLEYADAMCAPEHYASTHER